MACDPIIGRRLDPFITGVDRSVSITSPELVEARRRVQYLRAVISRETSCQVYVNGSIEHGDALTPLNDIDLGIVIDGSRARGALRRSPLRSVEEVARILERNVRVDFPNAVASMEAQKRAILIVFDNSGSARFQFTADVIVALDCDRHRAGELFIPNLHAGTWERSNPALHTHMIKAANAESRFCWNRTVRLAKYWNRQVGCPFSSWNIKALALNCPGLDRETDTLGSLQLLFEFAHASVSSGPTLDPAGVSAPIFPEVSKKTAIKLLADMVRNLGDVVQILKDGDMKDASARFDDSMRRPDRAVANR